MQGDHGDRPETRVMMLTASTEEDAVVEAGRCGGYRILPEGDGPGVSAVSGAGRGPGGASRLPSTW